MILMKAYIKAAALKVNAGPLDGGMILATRHSDGDGGCVTHLQLFDIDTRVVGETFRVGDLDVGFLQFAREIVPHLGDKKRRTGKRFPRAKSSNLTPVEARRRWEVTFSHLGDSRGCFRCNAMEEPPTCVPFCRGMGKLIPLASISSHLGRTRARRIC